MIECFLIWTVMRDYTQTVHTVVGSQEEAEKLIDRCMSEKPASCGCCYDPSPAAIPGIRSMHWERRAFTVVGLERNI